MKATTPAERLVVVAELQRLSGWLAGWATRNDRVPAQEAGLRRAIELVDQRIVELDYDGRLRRSLGAGPSPRPPMGTREVRP